MTSVSESEPAVSVDVPRLKRAACLGVVLGILGIIINPTLGFVANSQLSETSHPEQHPPAVQVSKVIRWELGGAGFEVVESELSFTDVLPHITRKVDKALRTPTGHSSNVQHDLAHWVEENLQLLKTEGEHSVFGMQHPRFVVRAVLTQGEEPIVKSICCALATATQNWAIVRWCPASTVPVDQQISLLPVPHGVSILRGLDDNESTVIEVVSTSRELAELISEWQQLGYETQQLDRQPIAWAIIDPKRGQAIGVQPVMQDKQGSQLLKFQVLSL